MCSLSVISRHDPAVDAMQPELLTPKKEYKTMSYHQHNCAKCGTATNGMSAKTINDPRNPRYGLLVDLCPSCSSSKDVDTTLQNRLYPESDPDRELVDTESRERKNRAARYQKSKDEWIAANPNCAFPEGHE